MGEFKYKLVSTEEELKGAFGVRRQVFIGEQGIPEETDFDGRDGQALHVVVIEAHEVIGTARLQFLSDSQAKLERMAILKPFRRQGIGTGMISYLEKELRKRQVKEVILHAQYTAVPFYQACGFEKEGSPFWEAGMKHVKMKKQL